MIAVDDGLWQGNLNAADIFFLIAVFLAVIAAVLYAGVNPRTSRWAPVTASFAVASVALGLLLV